MTEAPPLVSVITIFLDEEDFLGEAVESVRAQTYPHWELLLCDDGSTDRSSAIARSYAANDPGRVRYLEHVGHANRGMSTTRNLGLKQARGEFVAFLDADDVWTPAKLEAQVAILQAEPDAGLVYGPSLTWFGWTGDPDDAARDYPRRLGVRPGRRYRGTTVLRRILGGHGESPGTCSTLVRRAAAMSVGGFEEEFRGMYEDQAFFAKMFLGYDAYVMADCHDRYRQHAGSACAMAERGSDYHTELPSRARNRYLEWLKGYLDHHGAAASLRWLVRREQWFYRHPRAARLRLRWLERSRAWRARVGALRG